MGKIQAPTGCQSCSSGKKYHARHLYSSLSSKARIWRPWSSGLREAFKHSTYHIHSYSNYTCTRKRGFEGSKASAAFGETTRNQGITNRPPADPRETSSRSPGDPRTAPGGHVYAFPQVLEGCGSRYCRLEPRSST